MLCGHDLYRHVTCMLLLDAPLAVIGDNNDQRCNHTLSASPVPAGRVDGEKGKGWPRSILWFRRVGYSDVTDEA